VRSLYCLAGQERFHQVGFYYCVDSLEDQGFLFKIERVDPGTQLFFTKGPHPLRTPVNPVQPRPGDFLFFIKTFLSSLLKFDLIAIVSSKKRRSLLTISGVRCLKFLMGNLFIFILP
jgi:hypothetical protein